MMVVVMTMMWCGCAVSAVLALLDGIERMAGLSGSKVVILGFCGGKVGGGFVYIFASLGFDGPKGREEVFVCEQ